MLPRDVAGQGPVVKCRVVVETVGAPVGASGLVLGRHVARGPAVVAALPLLQAGWVVAALVRRRKEDAEVEAAEEEAAEARLSCCVSSCSSGCLLDSLVSTTNPD